MASGSERPQPERPELIFGIVAVHDECAMHECHNATVAAAPMQVHGEIGVWWLCEHHADVLPWLEGIDGRRDPPIVYNLSPTCRANSLGPDLPPCGAAADYLVITQHRDPDGSPYLGVVSLCERHAKESADFLA